jgi:hypothetical protein
MQQRIMNSSQGMLTTAARLTGGNAAFTGSLGGMLSNAGQFFGSNPQNLFKMMSQQGRLAGAMSQEERLLQMTGTAMQVAGAMGFMDNGKVDTDTLAGISMNLFGMSSRDANAFVANVSSYKNADPRGDAMKQAIALREQQLQEHRLTIGDRFSGWWQENVSNNLVSASAEALIEMTRSNVSEGIRDISDS